MKLTDLQFTPGPWYPVDYAGYIDLQTTPRYICNRSILDKDHDGQTNDKISQTFIQTVLWTISTTDGKKIQIISIGEGTGDVRSKLNEETK